MLEIKCPYCGNRSQNEFSYGGDADIKRPELGKEISDNLYSAVASVLAYIFKIERGEETDYPEFEIPENMSFDEYGKTIK